MRCTLVLCILLALACWLLCMVSLYAPYAMPAAYSALEGGARDVYAK